MATHDNPDRVALAAFMAGPGAPVPMTSSRLLASLQAQIEHAEPGRVRLGFAPGADHVQGNGVVAGGVVATMLDFALAFAGLTTCSAGETAASLGLNVVFLAPVGAGAVTVEATLVSRGYRISQAEARLTGPQGQLLATGTSALAMKRVAGPEPSHG